MSPEPVLARMVGPPPLTTPATWWRLRLPCMVVGCWRLMLPEPVSAARLKRVPLPTARGMLPEPGGSLQSGVGRAVTALVQDPVSDLEAAGMAGRALRTG